MTAEAHAARDIALNVEARKSGWSQKVGGWSLTLSIADDADNRRAIRDLADLPKGQHLVVAICPVTQDGQPDETIKGGLLAKEAGRYCNDVAFQRFLGVDSPEKAAEQVRVHCGVSSRKYLDHDDEAAGEWYRLKEEFDLQSGRIVEVR